jgi:hypothetical protein
VLFVQVGHDRGVHVGGGVPERGELGGKGVMLADVEAGEPVIQVAGDTAGEVGAVGDRGLILPASNKITPLACSVT